MRMPDLPEPFPAIGHTAAPGMDEWSYRVEWVWCDDRPELHIRDKKTGTLARYRNCSLIGVYADTPTISPVSYE